MALPQPSTSEGALGVRRKRKYLPLYSVDPSDSLHTPGTLHLIERLPRVQLLGGGYGG
jgi:hypothetical protein